MKKREIKHQGASTATMDELMEQSRRIVFAVNP